MDARRRAIQNAPQVLYRNDPPLEIRNIPGVKDDGTGDIGYITFGKLSVMVYWEYVVLIDCSSLPPPSHPSTKRRIHISHPDIPRLLPLPHQGCKGTSLPVCLYI